MRIHCINPDDAYNSLLPVDPQFFKKVGGSFKPDTPQGFGKADPEPILRVRDKALKQGNFTGFVLGCLTCDREALESAAGQILSRAGWMLPVVQDQPRRELFFINITEEYDSFDRELLVPLYR